MDDLDAIGLLHEPLRRRLYDYVVAQDHEVSRREAADATGTPRTVVAFHLDKLVEAGLLETSHRRVSGRTGPGAGRPATLYRRAAFERQVTLPPRDYRTLAAVLAEAVEASRLDDELGAAARRVGAELGADAVATTLDQAVDVLGERGYEPHRVGNTIRLRNCPFHSLAESYPTVVCGMNLALLDGLLGVAGSLAVRMDPQPGECCVVVTSNDKID